MNNISRAAAWVTGSCLACAALAQDAPTVPPKTQADTARIDFATVDKDEDGRLSRQETQRIAALESAFEQLDADKDQAVSRAEFARWDRAGKIEGNPADPATAPRGSAGSQHMPDAD